MPGPGPRGPCETYRTPCSSIPDSRISARNPRKTGKSRRARGTRTRQTGTRSTRDGLLCGEIASAAGGTRARAARSAPAAERNPAHGPRSSSSSPASSPATDHQIDERRPFVCQIGMQTRRQQLAQLEQQLAGLYVLFVLVLRKPDQIAYRPAQIDQPAQLEALVPGIRSAGLDP